MPSSCKCRHYFAKSPTAGIGSFASTDIPENEPVFILLKRDQKELFPAFDRTDFCRLTNHSYKPNGKMSMIGNDLYAISNRKIKRGEEILLDYEDLLKQPWFKGPFEIKQNVLRITPGFEDMYIEDDSHKTLFDEIKYFRSMR